MRISNFYIGYSFSSINNHLLIVLVKYSFILQNYECFFNFLLFACSKLS